MPEITDVLNNDAFSQASMTTAINQSPTNPSELGAADMFVSDRVRTNLVGIEHRKGKLNIAAIDNRGDDVETAEDADRSIRFFETKRVSQHVRIKASELSFITQFGSNLQGAVEALQSEIIRRIEGPTGLRAGCNNALELMRLGAAQGKVVDRNGKIVYDFYREFGLTPPPEIVMGLSSTDEGDLRLKNEKLITRPLRRRAQGIDVSRPLALCGEEFWDKKMKNKEFRDTFKSQQESAELRSSTLGQTVRFAGIDYMEYFGTDVPSSIRIAADKAIVVPGGPTGMFQHVKSPGEGFADLGSEGQDWYLYMDRDPSQRDAYIDIYLQTYPGIFNNRPDLVTVMVAD